SFATGIPRRVIRIVSPSETFCSNSAKWVLASKAPTVFITTSLTTSLLFATPKNCGQHGFCWGRAGKTVPARYHDSVISLTPDNPQTLLVDADDTLWENNIYFE